MERLRLKSTANKAFPILITVAIFLCRSSSAMNHTVGGNSGWDLTSNLQAWTSETTFHVGDSLVFSYMPVHDVIEVGQEDYQSCVTSNPISTHNDGESVVPLIQPGSRYFICGRRGHCEMGLKLTVHVQSWPDMSPPPVGPGNAPPPPPDSPASGFQPRNCRPELRLVIASVVLALMMLVGVDFSVRFSYSSVEDWKQYRTSQ